MDGGTRRGIAALAAVFALAWAAGTTIGALTTTGPTPAPAAVVPVVLEPSPVPGTGLAASAAGWTLRPAVDRFTAGVEGEYVFALSGPDAPPPGVEIAVVRRDGAGFARAPATAGPDGLLRAPLTLPAAGVYRVYVMFTPAGGAPLRLGADVHVPGEFLPVPATPSRVAVSGRYQVRLDGELVAGSPSPVFATVSDAGAPVTELEPVDGAFGRLVAVRTSDLAWTDVPPDAPTAAPADRAGPGIAFTATLPVAGPHALFLQFRHAGAVHTVEFRVDVT